MATIGIVEAFVGMKETDVGRGTQLLNLRMPRVCVIVHSLVCVCVCACVRACVCVGGRGPKQHQAVYMAPQAYL